MVYFRVAFVFCLFFMNKWSVKETLQGVCLCRRISSRLRERLKAEVLRRCRRRFTLCDLTGGYASVFSALVIARSGWTLQEPNLVKQLNSMWDSKWRGSDCMKCVLLFQKSSWKGSVFAVQSILVYDVLCLHDKLWIAVTSEFVQFLEALRVLILSVNRCLREYEIYVVCSGVFSSEIVIFLVPLGNSRTQLCASCVFM